MGTADAVPGVSGGTVALILGIYDRLVAAISEVSVENLVVLLGAVRTPKAATTDTTVLATVERMDIPFLVALATGMLTAVIVLTRVVTVADETNPVAMFALFFGLIGASGIVLLRDVRPFDRAETVAVLLGAAVAFLVSGAAGSALGHTLPVVFVVGAIALSAMVMPGLSGSLLLIIFGQYTYLSRVLSEFTSGIAGLARGGGTGVLFDRGVIVVTFIAGGVVGVLTVARIVDRALSWNRSVTIAFLVGLVIGALRAPVREINATVGDWAAVRVAGISFHLWSPRVWGVVLAWTLVGAGLLVFVDRYLYRIRV